MPKPPILVAPSPQETIASATWGDPVTDAVNGLVTGRSIIGAAFWTNAATSSLSSTLAAMTISKSWALFDSDGYIDEAIDGFVIPPGLAGVYDAQMGFGLETGDDGADIRMGFRLNGTSFLQVQGTISYNSGYGMLARCILPLNDGDYIQAFCQKGGTTQTMKHKHGHCIRIADLPTPV